MPRARRSSRAATPPPCRPTSPRRGAYGINGVPFFVIDGKYGVSGAQPAEVFAQVLTQVAGERDEAAA